MSINAAFGHGFISQLFFLQYPHVDGQVYEVQRLMVVEGPPLPLASGLSEMTCCATTLASVGGLTRTVLKALVSVPLSVELRQSHVGLSGNIILGCCSLYRAHNLIPDIDPGVAYYPLKALKISEHLETLCPNFVDTDFVVLEQGSGVTNV